MDFKSWGQSPALQAFRNLPGDGVSCTPSPHVLQAGNCVSPRHLKTLRFYFPALVSFPVPENNSADFRNTHPRIVCIRQSVCLKAHTAQEWSDCLLERPAHLANDVGAHWGCPGGTLLFLPQPPCQLGCEAAALQRDRQANPAATTTSRNDPVYCVQVPPGPTGARQEGGMAQDDRRRGCQDLFVLPEDQAPSGLARGDHHYPATFQQCIETMVRYIRTKHGGTFGYIRVHSGTFGYIRAHSPGGGFPKGL